MSVDWKEVARNLEFALRGLYDDQVDYLVLNNLGGLDNHWMRATRIALVSYEDATASELPFSTPVSDAGDANG